MSKEVTRAMNQLQPDQREVLVLICAAGMSYEEAAEAIGCSIGTVKSRLWRARSRMAQLVLGEDESPRGIDGAERTPRKAMMDREGIVGGL
jgi:RNA polymerase sigma-70 factor (ECF subfamily)